jgi:hypothetical protein
MIGLAESVCVSRSPILDRVDGVDSLRAAHHPERVFGIFDDGLRILRASAGGGEGPHNNGEAQEAAKVQGALQNRSDVPS